MKVLLASVLLGTTFLWMAPSWAQESCSEVMAKTVSTAHHANSEAAQILAQELKETAWSFRRTEIDPLGRLKSSTLNYSEAKAVVESKHLRSALNRIVSHIRILTDMAIEDDLLSGEVEKELSDAFGALHYPLYVGRNLVFEQTGLQMAPGDHEALFGYFNLTEAGKLQKRQEFKNSDHQVKMQNRKAEFLKDKAWQLTRQMEDLRKITNHKVVRSLLMSTRKDVAQEGLQDFQSKIEPSLMALYKELIKQSRALDAKDESNAVTLDYLKRTFYLVHNSFESMERTLQGSLDSQLNLASGALDAKAFQVLVLESER